MVPTLIAWATGDIFFDVKWWHWLTATIPGTRRRIESDGARLLLPEERSQELMMNFEFIGNRHRKHSRIRRLTAPNDGSEPAMQVRFPVHQRSRMQQ
jgi:hypothetical protein